MNTSKNNRSVLIIPDIHHRVDQAEKIIKHVGADEIIFLGDYFDDFNDDVEMVKHTCDWLSASVEQKNRIHLFGNHDVHYAFTNRQFQCSGYAQWKYFMIHDNVERKVWDKLKFYHILDNTFLLTHASMHKRNLPKEISNLHADRKKFYSEIASYLDANIIKGFRGESWIFGAGHSRGGNQPVGGIIWCDYTQEFYPVSGLNQIFGHTPQGNGTPKWCIKTGEEKPYFMASNKSTPKTFTDVNTSINIDLDVHGTTHWAVWNGTELKIGNVRDDM